MLAAGMLAAISCGPRTPAGDAVTGSVARPSPISPPARVDETVDEESVDFLLDDPAGQPGAIDASGDPWKPYVDPCPTCPHAPPKTSWIVSRLAVPKAPDATERCDVPAPVAMCRLPSAPDASVDGALATCGDALLAGRGLGRIDGDAVLLTRAGATAVVKSAITVRLDGLALERSPSLAALAGAAAVAEVESAAFDDAHRGAALGWCRRLAEDLGRGAASDVVAADLTCLARIAGGASTHPLQSTWSGCRCGERGARGRTCYEASSIKRPFPDVPIDPRMAAALDEAVDRVNAVFATEGWTLVGLGLVGCHLPRFERGAEVRGLGMAPSPRLRFAQVSDHSLGNACDISYAWVRTPDGKVRGFSVHMLELAMLDPKNLTYDPSPTHVAAWRDEARAIGEAIYYERPLLPGPPDPSKPIPFALHVGFTLRNAFVDSGLVVFTPATNSAHGDHFHVQLPLDDDAWAEQSADDTTHARREQLIAADLRRAAGLDASEISPTSAPVAPPELLDIVEIESVSAGVRVSFAAGKAHGMSTSLRGELLDDAGQPVSGGHVFLARVERSASYGFIYLPPEVVAASGKRVRFTSR